MVLWLKLLYKNTYMWAFVTEGETLYVTGSRSQKGADYFTRVYSVLESYRKKGKLKGLLNSG